MEQATSGETAIYKTLFTTIVSTYLNGKASAFKAVNSALVETYWEIGRHIVQFEQGGSSKAEYGDKLLEKLSKDLSLSYGRGFSLSNIKRFRQFYLAYPNGATVPHHFNAENEALTKGAEASYQLQRNDNQLIEKGAKASHQLNWSHYVEPCPCWHCYHSC